MAQSLPERLRMSISYELAHCPACGSDDAEMIANADDIRAEVETLWNFHIARRKQGVPVSQLFDRAFFSQAAVGTKLRQRTIHCATAAHRRHALINDGTAQHRRSSRRHARLRFNWPR